MCRRKHYHLDRGLRPKGLCFRDTCTSYAQFRDGADGGTKKLFLQISRDCLWLGKIDGSQLPICTNGCVTGRKPLLCVICNTPLPIPKLISHRGQTSSTLLGETVLKSQFAIFSGSAFFFPFFRENESLCCIANFLRGIDRVIYAGFLSLCRRIFGHVHMTSANCLDFLPPPPLSALSCNLPY